MSDPKRKLEPWLRNPDSSSNQQRRQTDPGFGSPLLWLDLLARRRPPSERYSLRSLVVLAVIAAVVVVAAVAKENRTSEVDQLQKAVAPMMATPVAGEDPIISTTSTTAAVTTTSTSASSSASPGLSGTSTGLSGTSTGPSRATVEACGGQGLSVDETSGSAGLSTAESRTGSAPSSESSGG